MEPRARAHINPPPPRRLPTDVVSRLSNFHSCERPIGDIDVGCRLPGPDARLLSVVQRAGCGGKAAKSNGSFRHAWIAPDSPCTNSRFDCHSRQLGRPYVANGMPRSTIHICHSVRATPLLLDKVEEDLSLPFLVEPWSP